MTIDLAPGEAMLVDWPADRYHADTEFTSRSALEDLRSRPMLFFCKHEARVISPEPPNAAMQLGTNVHLCLFEPDEWKRRVYPEKPRRPDRADGRAEAGSFERELYNAWKRAVDVWREGLRSDSIVLSQAERLKVEMMAMSVRSHEFCKFVLETPGTNEQTILWHHPLGVKIRVRLDGMREVIPATDTTPATLAVLDLKTTRDPSEAAFQRSIHRYGYHRQAAIYVDALRALRPGVEIHYVIAAVSSTAPFESGAYELGPDELAVGRRQYEATISDLLRRRETNDWRAPWQHGCRSIQLPHWAYEEQ